MNLRIVTIAVSLVAGVAAAAIVLIGREPEPAAAAAVDASDYFDQSAATEDRIGALEAAVAAERNARQLLEEELQILYAEIDRLSTERDESARSEAQRVADIRQNRERMEEFRQRRGDRSGEDRVNQLVDAGFPPDRAAWILQRESELQMAAMQARFDARRTGEPFDFFSLASSPDAALRAEIGDADYEQFLQANNRPTAVSVGGVLESSPGQRAGLQPGDQIVSYNGNRVYDVGDLNRQIMLGEAGESVVVDISRDGIPIQVVMPRGPIGISTSRFPRRR